MNDNKQQNCENADGESRQVEQIVIRRCIGYGEFEGKCKNSPGTPWTPYWCDRCDKIRRETITKSLEDIAASFNKAV